MAIEYLKGRHPTVRIVQDRNFGHTLELFLGARVVEGLRKVNPNVHLTMPMGMLMEAGVFTTDIPQNGNSDRSGHAKIREAIRKMSESGVVEFLEPTRFDDMFFQLAQMHLLDKSPNEIYPTLKGRTYDEIEELQVKYNTKEGREIMKNSDLVDLVLEDFAENAVAEWYREYLKNARKNVDLSTDLFVFVSDDKEAREKVQQSSNSVPKAKNHCWCLTGEEFVAFAMGVLNDVDLIMSSSNSDGSEKGASVAFYDMLTPEERRKYFDDLEHVVLQLSTMDDPTVPLLKKHFRSLGYDVGVVGEREKSCDNEATKMANLLIKGKIWTPGMDFLAR